MNFIFLSAIIFTQALVHGEQGEFWRGSCMSAIEDLHFEIEPCQEKSKTYRYKEFVLRHILNERFNRSSLPEWKRYLEKYHLCGRTEVQSFIEDGEGQVQQICGSTGRRVKGATGKKGNLCISESIMTVYNVKSVKNPACKVNSAELRKHKVVVACNKVQKRCLPVHYEKYSDQEPDNLTCM